LDNNSLGVLLGGSGAGISLLTIGVGQYNRWRDRKAAADKSREDQAASQPDHAVKRLSEALDQLASENSRLQAKIQQLMTDYDTVVGENRKLRKELEDLRTKWNKRTR
jgi:succinate dehydrogenase/fumarate reductase flavoprotein subunit